MRIICSFFMLIARICISAIFLFAGVHKLIDYNTTASYMAAKNLPAMPYLFAASFVEIIGGLSLLLGYKTRFGALILLLFLIPTTYLFHDFWNIDDQKEMQMQLGHFLSNLAIFGGLLYILCMGAGSCSVDRGCAPVRPPEGV